MLGDAVDEQVIDLGTEPGRQHELAFLTTSMPRPLRSTPAPRGRG